MTLKEYIKLKITPYGEQPNLIYIYEELKNLNFFHTDIYYTIQEVLVENLNQIIKDYEDKKNEN